MGIRGFGSDVNGNSGVYSDAKQYLVAYNKIFSPSIVNDLRLNYTRGFSAKTSLPRSPFREEGTWPTNSASQPDLRWFTFIPNQSGRQQWRLQRVRRHRVVWLNKQRFNVEERFNINDIVYWNRGSKTWKFGVDLSYARLNVIPFFGASGGRWEFRVVNTSDNRGTGVGNGGNNLASLLLGVPNVVQVRPLLLNYDYRWKAAAAFVQNDWKIKPNLTVNLGLRYQLQYPGRKK